MGKYAKDLNPELVQKVKSVAAEYGLNDNGLKVEVLRLTKIGKEVGEIVKGNDLVKLFADGKDVVALALLEEAFDMADEHHQEVWIRNLVSQIVYDEEKEKVKIEKPEVSVTLSVLREYKTEAVNAMETAQMVLEQLREEEKMKKEQEKANKKQKKD